MGIQKFRSKLAALFLALQFFLAPGMVALALAQDAPAAATSPAASDDEVQTIQQLAKNGYLGDKKDSYLKAQDLTEDDITDALLKANETIMAIDMKQYQSLKNSYQVEDLQSLLELVKDKAANIRARKVSAWKLENRLQKMIALSTVTSSTAATPSAPVQAPTATNVPPTPTATPIPGPSREEFNSLKESFKSLDAQLTNVQADLDKKTETLKDIQADGRDTKLNLAENQEQLKLIKKLLDRVQDDLMSSEDNMDEIDKKVDQKMATDIEMRQDITIMHKDLRDDTEDISVLKEQVAKLDKTDYGPKNPVDEFLSSKWLPGGALVVGLTALVLELVRK